MPPIQPKYVPEVRPTLLEYYLEGYRHLRVSCLASLCFYVGTVEIAQFLGRRRDVPVDKLSWSCPSGHNGTRFEVTAIEQTRCGHCATLRMARSWHNR